MRHEGQKANPLLALQKRPARVVELGAGTGLCSLAAVATGHQALATDYREEPLALLRQARPLALEI